jgi:hypothetical protein
MGYIKEPEGIDLNLSPIPLTDEDKKQISEIIAEYKKAGKIPKVLRRKKKFVSRRAVSDAERVKVLKKESKKEGESEVVPSGK